MELITTPLTSKRTSAHGLINCEWPQALPKREPRPIWGPGLICVDTLLQTMDVSPPWRFHQSLPVGWFLKWDHYVMLPCVAKTLGRASKHLAKTLLLPSCSIFKTTLPFFGANFPSTSPDPPAMPAMTPGSHSCLHFWQGRWRSPETKDLPSGCVQNRHIDMSFIVSLFITLNLLVVHCFPDLLWQGIFHFIANIC